MLTGINVCVTQICLELLLRLNSGTLSYILSVYRKVEKVNVFMMGFLMLEPLFQITVKSAGKLSDSSKGFPESVPWDKWDSKMNE